MGRVVNNDSRVDLLGIRSFMNLRNLPAIMSPDPDISPRTFTIWHVILPVSPTMKPLRLLAGGAPINNVNNTTKASFRALFLDTSILSVITISIYHPTLVHWVLYLRTTLERNLT